MFICETSSQDRINYIQVTDVTHLRGSPHHLLLPCTHLGASSALFCIDGRISALEQRLLAARAAGSWPHAQVILSWEQ